MLLIRAIQFLLVVAGLLAVSKGDFWVAGIVLVCFLAFSLFRKDANE